jgi:ParB family transcriptional regulator, chromosome partitioning protein
MAYTYPFKSITCQLLDFPDPFIRLLHEGTVDCSLVDQLQQFGQTVPLLVWQQKEKRYQILANYLSFRAIKSLGLEEVTCQVLPFSTPPIHRYSLQILHGLAAPQASPILQAHLLQQARQHLTDRDLFALLAMMGHKPQRYKLDELTDLLHLSSSAIVAMHRGVLSPKTGKLLKLTSQEDQEVLIRLINTYRPGGSKQQKLIAMIIELSLRDNKPVQEVLRGWLPMEKEFTEENAPQRLQGLLHFLQDMFWPEKSKMEKNFQKFVQELRVPDWVSITPTPSFEDEGVEMHLRFVNSEELKKKWEKIKAFIQQG